MRAFNQFDKNVIRDILLLESPMGIALEDLMGRSVSEDFELDFYAFPKEQNPIKNSRTQYRILAKRRNMEVQGITRELQAVFFQINDLLDYLIKEGLLKVYEGRYFLEARIHGNELIQPLGKKGVVWIQPNTSTYALMEKFQYSYKPAEELRKLVKQKFVSNEERYSKQNTSIAAASVLTAVLSLFITSLNTCNQQKVEVLITSSTVDSILNKVKLNRMADLNSIKNDFPTDTTSDGKTLNDQPNPPVKSPKDHRKKTTSK